MPVALSEAEVGALLQSLKSLKHRTILTTIYASRVELHLS